MRAVILNCTLKSSPGESSTEALAKVVSQELQKYEVSSEIIRVADHNILPGVESDEGEGDARPQIREKIVAAEIIIMASPTWVGRMTSMAQKVIERMDAFLAETDEAGRPIAYNHVAGFVATGNEDGAKHVIAEMTAALTELGFTVPGQAWSYFNQGAAMGSAYIETDDEDAKQRTYRTAKTAAHDLAAVAKALQANPIPPEQQ